MHPSSAPLPLRWEATPPPGAYPPAPAPRTTRYLGPPAYYSPPRWGFPTLAWRRPTTLAGLDEGPPPPVRVHTRGTTVRALLWTLVVLAGLAAGAEAFRYVLLVQGRSQALSRQAVVLSDTLVVTAATMALIGGATCVGVVVWWLRAARTAAADHAGYLPPRPDWQIVPSLFVPVLNIAVAGSLMAELEHAALRKPADERPKPSPLLRLWWWALAGSAVLFTVTLVWRFRGGVQAQADGVLLTALTDLAAAGTAALTALVVARLTSLLAPLDPATLTRLRVVSVSSGPDPARRDRPTTHRR